MFSQWPSSPQWKHLVSPLQLERATLPSLLVSETLVVFPLPVPPLRPPLSSRMHLPESPRPLWMKATPPGGVAFILYNDVHLEL